MGPTGLANFYAVVAEADEESGEVLFLPSAVTYGDYSIGQPFLDVEPPAPTLQTGTEYFVQVVNQFGQTATTTFEIN